jgi:CRP-like cAMP-binding protein
MAPSSSTVATLLGKTPFFGPLEQGDRAVIARRMLPATFKPGQAVFARGDAGRDVFLVVEGRVRLSVYSADGRLLSFKHASAGDIFGEIAALDGNPRTADAVALTRVVAMTLAQDQLNKLIEGNPRVAHATIAWLCRRLRDTSAQVEAIALYPVEVRLARYLLSRLSPPQAGDATIELSISQSELASLIGASRQKVNAALGLLEDAGAIARVRRRITCDLAKLMQAADPD